MGLLPDYSQQATGYDSTRGASPSVLSPLRRALDGAPGRRLLDIGGGTGNYALALAQEGWQPTVLDRSAAMLDQARAKGLRTVPGNAQELPLADRSFDAVMLISMLHHVDRPELALSEAERILQPGGRLALMVFTREDIADSWIPDYFPSSRSWLEETHLPLEQLLAMLPGATLMKVDYKDIRDGSLAALTTHPQLILDERHRSQTSFFERMERDHPEELLAGLDRLAGDLSSGHRQGRPDGGSVLAWVKPGGEESPVRNRSSE
jgi:SAM-dependent methyltransferase